MRFSNFIVVAVVIALVTRAAPAFSDPVDDLINQLNSEDFDEREAAQQALTEGMKTPPEEPGGYPPAQVKKIRDAAILSTEPEIRHRARAILAAYTTMYPNYKALESLLGCRLIRSQFGDTVSMMFAESYPSIDVPSGSAQAQFMEAFHEKATAVLAALRRGDTPAAQNAHAAFMMFVDTPANRATFDELRLLDANRWEFITFLVLFDRTFERLSLITQVGDNIDQRAGGTHPGPPATVPVDAPGDQPTGKTFKLDLDQVPSEGGIDIWIPQPGRFDFRLPRDYELVGQTFDVTAADGLTVAGLIEVTIEYGESQLIGNRVRDAEALQFVRYENGYLTFLDVTNIDLLNHTLTAAYMAPDGPNQFGQFTLVQLVPETSSAVLALIAVAVLQTARRHRLLCKPE